jgi:hypothetical protein
MENPRRWRWPVPSADSWTSSWTGNPSTTSSVLRTKLRLWVAGRLSLSESTLNSFSLRPARSALRLRRMRRPWVRRDYGVGRANTGRFRMARLRLRKQRRLDEDRHGLVSCDWSFRLQQDAVLAGAQRAGSLPVRTLAGCYPATDTEFEPPSIAQPTCRQCREEIARFGLRARMAENRHIDAGANPPCRS